MDFDLTQFLSVVLSLVILEFLLSVDNALVNVSIAQKLPEDERNSAVRLGIGLAAGFRVIALLLASIIIHNAWLKVAGGLYLFYLMLDHLGNRGGQVNKTPAPKSYKKVVLHIAFADLVFSIDNVVSAVGLSDNISYIVFGVLAGMVAILLMSRYLLKVVGKFPRLAVTGYLVVGFIGAVMLIEELAGSKISPLVKFAVIISMAAFTVFYERNASLRRQTSPVLRVAERLLSRPSRLLR